MGVGLALTEGRILDVGQTGKMVNANLHDYKLPTAPEVAPDVPAAATVELLPDENPFKTELKSGAVSYTPLDPMPSAKGQNEIPAATANPSSIKSDSELPTTPADGAQARRDDAAEPPPMIVPEIRCLCPVCRSELRIPMSVASTSDHSPQMAERVNPSPAAGEKTSLPQTTHEPLPLAERERQIAEARQTLQVSVHAPMKPRLSVILSEEARTVSAQESASSSQSGGETGPPSPDINTLSE